MATDILEAVSNYQKDTGIKDEALEIPVDLSILEDAAIRAVMELENEIGSKRGLSVSAHVGENEGNGSELDVPEPPLGDDTAPSKDTTPPFSEDKHKEEVDWTKKVQSYYTRILLFAFITKDRVISLADIIAVMETVENSRIAKNLGLSKQILTLLNQKTNKFVLSDLDYKIQDLNNLSRAPELSPDERANVAVHKFGKLGDAIVITPSNICDDMVKLLPEDFIKSLPSTNGRILDIAGTAGEFAVALYKRMTELGLDKDFIANAIYTIPKSALCYELTRKLYDMFGLNTSNIAKKFIATDMLDIKIGNTVDYDKINGLLTQNKPFETIKLTDMLTEGEEKMRFDAVVGNPPYQEERTDNGRKLPIYNLFMDAAFRLSNIVSLITPARFLFNAGETPKEWNSKILNDEHFTVVKYWQKSIDVFPTVEIKGGVAITLRNQKQSFEKVGVFTAYDELNAILYKVNQQEKNTARMDLIVSSQGICRFTEALFSDFPQIKKLAGVGTGEKILSKVVEAGTEVFLLKHFSDSIQILAKGKSSRITRFIHKKYIQKNEFISSYKVLVPESNGNGAFEPFSSPEIARPEEAFSDTFLAVGAFGTQGEAENCLKYIKTKFTRALLGVLKVTQHNPKSTWKYIPLQDFTANSDIDWSKSVAEIDQQLYAKYKLSAEEVEFIEKNVREMA